MEPYYDAKTQKWVQPDDIALGVVETAAQVDHPAGMSSQGATDGQNLSAGAASVTEAYPNADPEMVRRNTLEINEAAAKARVPKLVRDLMQQRIDEAQYEVKRLQDLLDNANPALLDCTLDDAQKIFG